MVSLIGEAWSPKTEPPKTALTEINIALTRPAAGSPLAVAKPLTMGIVMGIIMAKVPHEVPVENDIRAERVKTITGTRAKGKPPATTASERKLARPNPPSAGDSVMIVPIDQAIAKIKRAGTIELIPSLKASEASLMENRRRAK